MRDALLGRPIEEFDVEVFALPPERLEPALAKVGRVDSVGQSFRVYKVSGIEGMDGAVDVSLPRRDSKVGPGHRGIAARGDPALAVAEAARRRDFTINALLFDPATGELLDPWGGAPDIQKRRLRAVDASTFGEDPLRALRAVQLAARFELEVDAETAALCASMPLAELPAERIFGEIEKLLLRARRPSRGFALMKEWGMLEALAPELLPLETTPQEPDLASRGRRLGAHPAGARRGRPPRRGPRGGPPATARGDAGRPRPRPRQARHHATARTAASALPGTRRPVSPPSPPSSTGGTSTRSSAMTSAHRCWRWSRSTSSPAALRRAGAGLGRGDPAARAQGRAGPPLSRGAGPTASDGVRGASSRWRWSGSGSGRGSSRSRRGRRSRS